MLLAEELLAIDEGTAGSDRVILFRDASSGRLSMPLMDGPIPMHVLAALSEPNSTF